MSKNKTSKAIGELLTEKFSTIPTREEFVAIGKKYRRMEEGLRECAKTEWITFMRQRQIAKEALDFDPLGNE